MKKIFLYVVLISSVFSCNTKEVSNLEKEKEFSDEEKQALSSEIKNMLHDYFTTVKKEGLTGELKYLDNSKDFYWVPPGFSGPINYDSVVSILTTQAPRFSMVENSWNHLSVHVFTPELATFTGQIHSKMESVDGRNYDFTLVETGVIIKRKEGWKLLSGQTTDLQSIEE